jgi:hypothetical protein
MKLGLCVLPRDVRFRGTQGSIALLHILVTEKLDVSVSDRFLKPSDSLDA